MSERKTETVGYHWGHYQITADAGRVVAVDPPPYDGNPSGIGESLLDAQDRNCRISAPMVRKSYLRSDGDHREKRGRDAFVQVSWETALDLAAKALRNTIDKHGNQAIFGGSYGWSSVGLFHIT